MNQQPWRRRKPPEYYSKSTSDFEKMQWACGIPPRHWNVQFESLNFSTVDYEAKDGADIITANVQKEYFFERLKDASLMASNRFVCITSHPSDEQAIAAGCLLATAYIESQWPGAIKVRVDDIQDYEQCMQLDKSFYSVEPEVLMLYNLNENSGRERFRLASDIIRKFEGSYRVILAACDNPLKFSRDFLKMEPQEVYHFEGKRLRKRMER